MNVSRSRIVRSGTFQTVAVVADGAFRVSGAPLRLDNREVGTLVLGTSLDNAYAEVLADLSSTGHRHHGESTK